MTCPHRTEGSPPGCSALASRDDEGVYCEYDCPWAMEQKARAERLDHALAEADANGKTLTESLAAERARAQLAEQRLADVGPMIADCEGLRAKLEAAESRLASLAESGTGYSQETVDAQGQQLARLTSEVERLWACLEKIDRLATDKLNTMAPASSGLIFLGCEYEIKARSLPDLEKALGTEGGKR